MRVPLTVRFGDVDAAGILYYPRLYHCLHVAMEEVFAAELGIDYAELVGRDRRGFPTVSVETEFRRPLRHGDEIEVEVAVERVGRSSTAWRYRVFRRGESEPAIESRQITANMDLDTGKAEEIPAELRAGLERLRPEPAE